MASHEYSSLNRLVIHHHQGAEDRYAREPEPLRAFDVVCALAGLALLAPVLAMIALAIKLDDGGPVLYSQDRVGKGLSKFRLFKFRSMFAGCAEGSLLTAPGDARITRVGRFLRKYKLDELPQLVNVLKGEMRLVGVRPQVQRFVDLFPDEYRALLQSPPGITGLASLSFRHEELLFHESSMEELYVSKILPVKLQIALHYSKTRTFLSDLEILFRTVLGFPSPSWAWEGIGSDRGRRVELLQSISFLHAAALGALECDSSHRNDELDKVSGLP